MRRPATWWILGTAVLALVFWLAVPRSPAPWAITSEAADGTDIVRRVLVDLGVEVVEGDAERLLPGLDPDDVAVVFEDRLTDADEQLLAAHVDAGGRLLIADPRSPLAGAAEVVAGEGLAGRADCDLLPADTTATLERAPGPAAGQAGAPPVPDVFVVPEAANAACWQQDGRAFLALLEGEGGGHTIVLGDPLGLANASIAAAPHLGRVAGLLVPDGDGRVVVAIGSAPPPAPTRPVGAVPANLVAGMWVAALAALLYALGRARRHGGVVTETPPVEVPASELAMGIAELLQRHGRADHAAARLRESLRAEVAPLVGADEHESAALLAATTAATALPDDVMARALGDAGVTTTDELVGVTDAVGRVRRALGLVPTATAAATAGAPASAAGTAASGTEATSSTVPTARSTTDATTDQGTSP